MLRKNFTLLHSDMTGEVNDPAWNLKLHSRIIPSTNIDDTGKDIKNTYSGDKSENNFNNK